MNFDSLQYLLRDHLQKIEVAKNKLEEITKNYQAKSVELDVTMAQLKPTNLKKLISETVTKSETSLLQAESLPNFNQLNIQPSIEYLTNKIYDNHRTFCILHFLDLDESQWPKSLSINLFKTVRSLFNEFYQMYKASYLEVKLTQELDLVMIELEFKGIKPVTEHRAKQGFTTINSLIRRMHGDFKINTQNEDVIHFTIVTPTYI